MAGPPPNVIKVNMDAAMAVHRNVAVISAVCRDSSGAVVKCGVSTLHGISDVELSETYAIRLGLQMAASLQVTDAFAVISRIQQPNSAIDNIQLIVEDCLAIARDFHVVFRHVRRNCNYVAHALAK
ncbi:uncharacterized protein LOC130015613 [Mercurialis annua]|uniref:uncharacterized protein LOC130015613 n=1 Tax=Mercurialis annua TaxID=3986 RepID=UPI0024AD285B|nr:uncharacterized protein LOC130015613 [Mercurialis annua]